MVEFFEPEDEFKTEKGYKKNTKTKIIFITALLIFGLILIFAVREDFVNIFKAEKIEVVCVYQSTYNRADDDSRKLEKAQKALKDHLATIRELDGFLKASIKFDENIKDREIPVMNIYFNKISKDKNRIPEILCGYKVEIVVKK